MQNLPRLILPKGKIKYYYSIYVLKMQQDNNQENIINVKKNSRYSTGPPLIISSFKNTY